MKTIRFIMWCVLFAGTFGSLNGCTESSTPNVPFSATVEGVRSGDSFYITRVVTSDGVVHQFTNPEWKGVMN